MKVSVFSHIYDAIETEFFVEFKFYLAKRRNSFKQTNQSNEQCCLWKKEKEERFLFFRIKVLTKTRKTTWPAGEGEISE